MNAEQELLCAELDQLGWDDYPVEAWIDDDGKVHPCLPEE